MNKFDQIYNDVPFVPFYDFTRKYFLNAAYLLHTFLHSILPNFTYILMYCHIPANQVIRFEMYANYFMTK